MKTLSFKDGKVGKDNLKNSELFISYLFFLIHIYFLLFFFYNGTQNSGNYSQTVIRFSHKEIQDLTIYYQFSFAL